MWWPAVERAQLAPPRPRIHDLRHTCASWMITAGVPLPVIQRHLGHESIKTTIDLYGHLDRSSAPSRSGCDRETAGPNRVISYLPALADKTPHVRRQRCAPAGAASVVSFPPCRLFNTWTTPTSMCCAANCWTVSTSIRSCRGRNHCYVPSSRSSMCGMPARHRRNRSASPDSTSSDDPAGDAAPPGRSQSGGKSAIR
ncbi:tyrosine-type recombinase/integrase [Mycobacterium branderi]|uniref:tyrosine-type recombinase/integrase n=1 Tax=Mycobacterium branderi TaxID=43348 RepID=UPI002F96C6ED